VQPDLAPFLPNPVRLDVSELSPRTCVLDSSHQMATGKARGKLPIPMAENMNTAENQKVDDPRGKRESLAGRIARWTAGKNSVDTPTT